MNNQLIEKVIKSNNEACPPLVYQNPTLDRTVASALSRGFVKILKVSRQNPNINNNLRFSVLENIRRLCQVESEHHLKIDESVTELLTETYNRSIEESISSVSDTTDKILDAFLLKSFKCVNMDPSFKSLVNPEIVQALNILDDSGIPIQSLSQELIHWDIHNPKSLNVLQDMWNNNKIKEITVSEKTLDDVSIKMKSEIERILLETCYKILQNNSIDLELMFVSDNSILNLVKNCSVSPESFQICSSILNYLFISKNFDLNIHNLISVFVNHVKLQSPHVSFSMLYPRHISSLVLLLDINIKDLQGSTNKCYVEMVTSHLKSLHDETESELILLLSHFPDWFDIYFKKAE